MPAMSLLAAALPIPCGLAAQQPARYEVKDIGTFGRTFSTAFGISNAGRVGGTAALPNGNAHPFLSGLASRGQEMEGLDSSLEKTDLGTLGGPNGQASGPNGRGYAAVLSETSTPDPLKQDFCGFGNHLICLGGVWNGAMTLYVGRSSHARFPRVFSLGGGVRYRKQLLAPQVSAVGTPVRNACRAGTW
jgi:hypothetical protein